MEKSLGKSGLNLLDQVHECCSQIFRNNFPVANGAAIF
jgi:hypothetical protein